MYSVARPSVCQIRMGGCWVQFFCDDAFFKASFRRNMLLGIHGTLKAFESFKSSMDGVLGMMDFQQRGLGEWIFSRFVRQEEVIPLRG